MKTVKCKICNKDRNIMAVRINTDEMKNIYVECIECAVGMEGIEDEFIKTQNAFFDSAYKIRTQIDKILFA